MNEAIENVSSGSADESVAEAKKEDRLITYLKNLAKPPKDGAALANLRRGLGKPPKTVMEMYPYLGQFLSHEPKPRYENAVFIVAALFAFYPDAPTDIGNLGASLRRLKDESGNIEKRFVALLNADEDYLQNYLRQIIGLLKSNERKVAVNWQRLFTDIQFWGDDNRIVQRNWARSFWGDSYEGKNQNTQNTGGEK